MAGHREQLIDDLLRLVERTDLGVRVPADGLELWTIDCARRALGVDLRPLDAHVESLRGGLHAARGLLRERGSASLRASFEQACMDVDGIHATMRAAEGGRALTRATRAVEAARAAMDCVDGRAKPGPTAALAREAFLDDDQLTEVDAQLRRLLLRCKLLPSGVELLVRLDYAEARGVLPRDPEQREWLDAQRQKMMTDTTERRLIVVIRYFEQVFLAEFERAG